METPLRKSRSSAAHMTNTENYVASSPFGHSNWTVTQLKDELRQRNLPTSGKKADLIERLEVSNSPVKASPKPSMIITAADASVSQMSDLYSACRLVDLQDELKQRGLPIYGNKADLVDRLVLQDCDNIATLSAPGISANQSPRKNLFLESARGRQKTRAANMADAADGSDLLVRLSKSISRSVSKIRAETLPVGRKSLNILHSFLLQTADAVSDPVNLTVILTLAVVSTLYLVDGPQQVFLAPYKDAIEGYVLLVILGFLSSIGVGGWFGGHLGRWVAQIASVSASCGSGTIKRVDVGEFRCVPGIEHGEWNLWEMLVRSTNLTRVLALAAPESLMWALGSVLAESLLFRLGRSQRNRRGVSISARNWWLSSLLWFWPFISVTSFYLGKSSRLSMREFATWSISAFAGRFAIGALVSTILFNKAILDRVIDAGSSWPELRSLLRYAVYNVRNQVVQILKEESIVFNWSVVVLQAVSLAMLLYFLGCGINAMAHRKTRTA